MIGSRTAAVVRRALCHCTKPAALLTAFLIVVDAASAATFTIGAAETVYTKKQRSSAGGSAWPDGSLGAIYNGDGTYDFYGANSSKVAYTTGTLNDPGATKQSAKVTGVPKGFSYLAGGPVFEDPYSGARLMIYHAEDGGKGKSFYSVLGMAISTDPAGQTFRDLGVIVRSNLPAGNAEMGGGSFAIVNGYMNVYFADFMADGNINFVATARASMADVITNALNGRGTTFNKYYNGAWTEPGIGGRSTAIETGNPANSWLGVSYNTYLNEVVMVNSQWSDDGGDLYITSSSDGVHFAPRQALAVDPGEQYYPSIVGIASGPQQSGQSFYAYYTDSKKGAWGRWGDAELRRREITITSPGSASNVNPLGYTADWVPIANFQDDFQPGTPATGWKYAWDPKGKVGKQSAYVPLVWSNSAQGYNTTGGATTVPNPKAHSDDFLVLTGDGGHPGQSKYMPMAGYTIQSDDGAGFYRLTDTSIQLANGFPQPKDDGLQMLVYVNDTLIGSPQSVLPGGGLTSFDRMLGSLNVGDTIWVMLNPLKNNNNDYFVNFNFSLEKLVYYAQSALAGASLQLGGAVPEPSTAALLIIALAAFRPRRRRN
jgi:hypothetical protein